MVRPDIAPNSPIVGTVADAIAANALAYPNAPAMVYPDGSVLDYSRLQLQIISFGETLAQAGLLGSRIAVMLPDGPELAIALAAVACHATAAPINPSISVEDFGRVCASQNIGAILLPDWVSSAAHEAAARFEMCRVWAHRIPGGVALSTDSPLSNSSGRWRKLSPDDAAFILRTSGTTARPKQVAITHRKL